MRRIIFGVLGLTAATLSVPSFAQETVTSEQIAGADLTKGQRAFLRCRACHTLGEDERNKVGPNLWNIFGRHVGSREGFNYSAALQGADFVWSADKLNEWLTKPKDFLPGNKMAFVGLPKEQQRVDLIAYLMNETGFSMDEFGGSELDDDSGNSENEETSGENSSSESTDSSTE